MSTPRALRPLRHPAYRWLALSLSLSLASAGLWMVAMVWQIMALGGDPSDLSAVTAAAAGGMVVTSLLGGAIADRVPQRRILVAVELSRTVAVGAAAGLSGLGLLQVWHLGFVALVGGVTMALYYPAYSALLPALLHEDELLAANGLEGMLRPVLMQAAGPAAASALLAVSSPGSALSVTALAALGATVTAARIPETPVRREPVSGGGNPAAAVFGDIREGFAYMVRTPWLLGTLLFASVLILIMMGPFEVLVPFAIKNEAGGGAGQHAFVLAAFGIGGALGSLTVASMRMPRRYLTVMNLMWGLGCLPLVVFGVTDSVAVMVAAAFVVGAAFNGAVVIWGTLLQRRVPAELLGRVSSLDFFVSLAFMPLSMAVAGPAAALVGVTTVFLVAGTLPVLMGVVAVLAARMPRDELLHPLSDDRDAGAPVPNARAAEPAEDLCPVAAA